MIYLVNWPAQVKMVQWQVASKWSLAVFCDQNYDPMQTCIGKNFKGLTLNHIYMWIEMSWDFKKI